MGYKLLDDRNIRSTFFQALNAAEVGSWAPQISMKVNSDSETEFYKWLAAVEQMREWKGGRHEKRQAVEEFEIRNLEYEGTINVGVPERRRDKTGQIMARVRDLATRAGTHWEALLTTLIIAGEVSLCYDGQAYFDTDHVSGDSGTQSNDITIALVDGSAPTPTEMATAINTLIQTMYGFVDAAGEPINQNATQFGLMVPVTFMQTALSALNDQFLTSGVTNPFIGKGFSVQLIVNPRLTWTEQMALFRTDGATQALVMQEEEPITTDMIGPGSEEEFRNNRHLFGAKATRSVGYGRWEHAVMYTFTDA